ncbi:MAG: NnrU family protein [Pseudohaliea sp.]
MAGVQRHPLLFAFPLWALAHIPPNGELATALFFAAMAVFCLVGMRALDRKRQRSCRASACGAHPGECPG